MIAIKRFFKFDEYRTDYATEVRAGIVTFMTMSYIIFVNPIILMSAGLPFESVLIATCVASALATIIMGLLARYPIAEAPGMGMNSFFVSVVISFSLPWQVVMGMVFWAGIIFLVLNLAGVWDKVVAAIPDTIKYASAAGIGAFIFYLGLKDAGIVTIATTPVALPSPGDFADPLTLISIGGLILTATLMARGVKGAILIGILGTGVVGALTGHVAFEKPQQFEYTAFMQLKIWDSINIIAHPEYIAPIVVMLFFDIFDSVGTMMGVAQQAGYMKDGVVPRNRQYLTADSIGSIIGALLGTSTVTSYIESAAGIGEGGRTGFANMITGLLFLVTLGVLLMLMHWGPGTVINAPETLSHITSPALIVVGVLMMATVTKIPWDKFDEALPALLTILIMPLSYRISMGLAVGFVSWPLLKLLKGEGKKVNWILYLLAGLIIVGFTMLELLGKAKAG